MFWGLKIESPQVYRTNADHFLSFLDHELIFVCLLCFFFNLYQIVKFKIKEIWFCHNFQDIGILKLKLINMT